MSVIQHLHVGCRRMMVMDSPLFSMERWRKILAVTVAVSGTISIDHYKYHNYFFLLIFYLLLLLLIDIIILLYCCITYFYLFFITKTVQGNDIIDIPLFSLQIAKCQCGGSFPIWHPWYTQVKKTTKIMNAMIFIEQFTYYATAIQLNIYLFIYFYLFFYFICTI